MAAKPALQRISSLVCAAVLVLAGCGGGGGGSNPPVISPPPPPPPPPPMAPSIDTQPVFTNLSFTAPVSMRQAPGDSSRWFIVEQNGIVRVFDNDPNVASSSVFIDIRGRVDSNFSESGLLGIAFHPSFPGTPEVFLSYTATGSPLISYVSRFTSGDGGLTLDAGSEEIIMTVIQDDTNHNGGDIAFGADGFLYASFGDGGGGGDPNDRGQNTANILGSITRINIDGNTPYEIPNDNPFFGGGLCLQGAGGASCPEIYAWGLRNPWRISFDSANGNLWTGDVGQGSFEEINRVENGQNYGWDDREGAHCFEPQTGCLMNSIDPVTEYGRSLGASVTGGYVYRGSQIASLQGWYVFADFVSGRVFAVTEDSQPTVVPEELLDTTLQISTFGEGVDGELYIVHYGGTLHQVVAGP